jgi:DNA primase
LSRFTPETVERVKEAADIVEIVSAYTELRRAGERQTGLCPFHEERTPSFSVDPREKLYHCFGCGVGGDVIKFVEEKEGLAFPEAVEALADRYGVEVEREVEDQRAEDARRRRARLVELLERTAQFYAACLWESKEAGKARDYLTSRGLGEEVLRAFGVGYAPSAWDRVLARGQRAGFSVAELAAVGLVQRGQKGGHYDRFRARIMFPVRDPRGRVQGFGARALRPETKPKYLNSPEGELYRKGRTLYGIDRARGAIAKAGRAVVVEGYTDVLAAHQAGIEQAVGVMGTAITPEQVKQLAAYTDDVVLALDADRSGREAMLRAQRVAGSRRLHLGVAAIPAGEDPAEMVLGGEAERLRGLIAEAMPLAEFHVRWSLDEADLSSPAGRDRALDDVVPVLAAMGESISRDELARLVADRLDADPGLVMRRVARDGGDPGRGGDRWTRPVGAQAAARAPAAGPEGARPLGARERRERALLAMCIASPAEGGELLRRLTPEHLSSPVTVRARDWLAAGHLEDPLAGLPREDGELLSLITQLVMSAEREPGGREAMELNLLQLEQAMIESRIGAARGEGADPPVELQRRRAELAERIAHWEGATTG